MRVVHVEDGKPNTFREVDGLLLGAWGVYQGKGLSSSRPGRWILVHQPTGLILSEYGCATKTDVLSLVAEIDGMMDCSTYDSGKTVKTSDELRRKIREIRARFERKTR